MLCLTVEPPSCILSEYTNTHNTSVVNNTMRLYVPKESVEKYKQSAAWNSAKGIYPLYPTSSVSLAKEVSVNKAKPTKLEYTILPENAGTKELEWSSENPEVAIVDANGIVTGKKIGKTVITAKTKDGTDITASTTFTVLPLKVETMTFAEPLVSIARTKDKTIKLTLNSEEVDNKRMIWTSSDESVATVVQNMNAVYPLEAIVVAHKVGKATIKAEAQDGSGMSTTCEVEVPPLMVSDFSLQTASIVKTIPTQLEANVSPAEADNKKLKWTSLTPDIATVTEDGMMTGLKMGTAKVKAETTDGSNLSCVFEVQVTGLPVSTISLPAESSIIKTESMKLECSILPLASDNQKLQWSSNATDIASVDESTGVITAHKVGDAVITATTTDGSGISASTTIHVTPLKVSQIEMPKDISLLYSLSKQIEVNIAPELADNKTLKWTSDNENIATVTHEGVVKGVNVGTTNITATAMDGSGVSATCKVTVKPVVIDLSTKTINLRKGESYAEQIVNVLPDNYEHKEVVWTSADNSIASVDSEGMITAVKPGITTIKYSLGYDSSITAECKVIVYDENVVYVGGIYYIIDKQKSEATVTSIYGGKNTSLDAEQVAQCYCYAEEVPEFIGVNNPANMDDVFQQATLHVIYGNEEAYKADAWWKRFYKIEGCNAPSDADKKVTSITISQTEATLKPNDTMQLEATVYPTDAANKKILWTSSNEDVAIVTDEGFVLAITEGEADIIAEASDGTGIKAMCHLTVENEKKPVVPIVEIKFEESPVTIVLGESKKLNVLFNPVNASNKTLQWKSVNSDVASVDKDGNVLGVSAGKSIIRAKTTDGSNLTINCVVIVIPSTGISNITMGEVKLIVNNRHLKVEGLADHEVIRVVNSIGFTVYRGTDHEVDLNASGIYIVKMRGKTIKFNVK